MKEITKKSYVSPVITMSIIQLEEGICGNTDEILGKDDNGENGSGTNPHEGQDGGEIGFGDGQ